MSTQPPDILYTETVVFGDLLIFKIDISISRNLSQVNGMIKATVKCQEHEMIVATKYSIDENFKGEAEFEATNLPSVGTLSTIVTFNVGEADKKVNILTKWNTKRFTDLDLSYRMTEDTFDGTLVVVNFTFSTFHSDCA